MEGERLRILRSELLDSSGAAEGLSVFPPHRGRRRGTGWTRGPVEVWRLAGLGSWGGPSPQGVGAVLPGWRLQGTPSLILFAPPLPAGAGGSSSRRVHGKMSSIRMLGFPPG